MNKLPKISNKIASLFNGWVLGDGVESSRDLKIMVEFYQSLYERHDSSKIYYRGITVTQNGFNVLIRTGKLKLKKRNTESWACRMDIAEGFMPMDIYLSQKNQAGIILQRKIPPAKVKFNLEKIWEAYKYVFDQMDFNDLVDGFYTNPPFGVEGYEMLERINDMEECELVTDTVCTSCMLEEVGHMRFTYEEFMLEFLLSDMKLDKKSKYLLLDNIKDQYVLHMSHDGRGSWTIDDWTV